MKRNFRKFKKWWKKNVAPVMEETWTVEASGTDNNLSHVKLIKRDKLTIKKDGGKDFKIISKKYHEEELEGITLRLGGITDRGRGDFSEIPEEEMVLSVKQAEHIHNIVNAKTGDGEIIHIDADKMSNALRNL